MTASKPCPREPTSAMVRQGLAAYSVTGGDMWADTEAIWRAMWDAAPAPAAEPPPDVARDLPAVGNKQEVMRQLADFIHRWPGGAPNELWSLVEMIGNDYTIGAAALAALQARIDAMAKERDEHETLGNMNLKEKNAEFRRSARLVERAEQAERERDEAIKLASGFMSTSTYGLFVAAIAERKGEGAAPTTSTTERSQNEDQ